MQKSAGGSKLALTWKRKLFRSKLQICHEW